MRMYYILSNKLNYLLLTCILEKYMLKHSPSKGSLSATHGCHVCQVYVSLTHHSLIASDHILHMYILQE